MPIRRRKRRKCVCALANGLSRVDSVGKGGKKYERPRSTLLQHVPWKRDSRTRPRDFPSTRNSTPPSENHRPSVAGIQGPKEKRRGRTRGTRASRDDRLRKIVSAKSRGVSRHLSWRESFPSTSAPRISCIIIFYLFDSANPLIIVASPRRSRPRE